ncbi:adenylyl-sulfate kinase, partial [Verrucomicrobiales bacterium]|nr:adenylyl-sulfate kinase [Verrucomicrobiales bacterium]
LQPFSIRAQRCQHENRFRIFGPTPPGLNRLPNLISERDPKGLYAKVKAGEVKNFTGKDSAFEEPEHADIIIETESQTEAKSLETLYQAVISRIERC